MAAVRPYVLSLWKVGVEWEFAARFPRLRRVFSSTLNNAEAGNLKNAEAGNLNNQNIIALRDDLNGNNKKIL